MNVEEYCLKIIPFLLKRYDRKRKGVAIDVGVGTFMFYCKVFRENKHITYAIEPLPIKELKDICEKNDITLIEKCIYSYNGTINIYTGRFNNNDIYDVSSVNSDWWGVDNESKTVNVECITIQSLFAKYKIEKITYLKIDTEGSEFEIIQQLEKIEKKLMPEIIEFEYGGGSTKKENINGWSSSYFNQTIKCIKLLKELQYRYALIFERELDIPIELKLDENIELQFKDNFVYGDIIFFKYKKFDINKLTKLTDSDFRKRSFLKKLIDGFYII